MKLTMYELLGLVKDDKAPEKVKYQDEVLYYDKGLKDYYNDRGYHCLFSGVNSVLHDEVEIIEDETKIPEKINYIVEKEKGLLGEYYNYYLPFEKANVGLCDVDKFIIDKINEIIDYLNSKGE